MAVKVSEVAPFFTKEYLRRFKRLKPLTRKTYFTYLGQYLTTYGTDFREENIEAFLRSLPKTVRNKAFAAIKHYAKFNGYPLKVVQQDFPEEFWYSEWDREYAERFSKAEIKKFCDAIREGKYRKKDAAALVLAIVWGLRKVEMINMIPERDIDLKNRVFLVRTAKNENLTLLAFKYPKYWSSSKGM